MTNNRRDFERRNFPRFEAVLPVRISGADFHFSAETKNISCSGLYCRVERFLPVMTKLALTMFLPLIVNNRKVEKEIRCTAVVVRVEPAEERAGAGSYSLGLFFSEIKEQDRRLISQYLQQAFFAGNN